MSHDFDYHADADSSSDRPRQEAAVDATGFEKSRLLLMGLRRSGKSSIERVVFHKMSPNETLFVESTTKIRKENVVSFIDLEIWDFPGHLDPLDPSFDAEEVFGGCGALVFVIDAQDDYLEALQRLYVTVTRAHKVNPDVSFEVLIHKVDGLSDDHKIGARGSQDILIAGTAAHAVFLETQRDIHQRITDELADAQLDNIHLSFYLTSIYDHSIYEAVSKVIQKLIPQLPTLENLLNILCSNSGIEKAFLFDVLSKIYIATDSSPVDMQSYELCSDMIDVILDVSSIYGPPGKDPAIATPMTTSTTNGTPLPPTSEGDAHATIKLNNGMVLYLREVNRYLSLVTLLREDNFEKQGLIDYNFRCFQEAIRDVFELKRRKAGQQRPKSGVSRRGSGVAAGSGAGGHMRAGSAGTGKARREGFGYGIGGIPGELFLYSRIYAVIGWGRPIHNSMGNHEKELNASI
ncbi:Gtr1/RagA G protein conserved region-domain-containing protein [Fimicolochytrium jonesii]|uniref:Gtr1/RagA G protein conserved region-domain-containing protein n=1 Tax=Fimicolochytrium jonesii TaxID=1396493 RepID=UPI0022FF0217|nr:Gtr1/RagA G protein conserved region-domain-containing protein [Fimicolochytrium jonesii]KAI8816544.1 Gtr1/RagA G protein conserved region-domain-containing protein [Fimicolochytrium jonesii]